MNQEVKCENLKEAFEHIERNLSEGVIFTIELTQVKNSNGEMVKT